MPGQTIEQVIERVKKLQRLATSTNVHEAASAAAMAAELMLEYQISEASLSASDENRDDSINEHYVNDGASKRRAVWKGSVANAIAKSLGCAMYWSGNHIVIVGRHSDSKAVEYLYQVETGLCITSSCSIHSSSACIAGRVTSLYGSYMLCSSKFVPTYDTTACSF